MARWLLCLSVVAAVAGLPAWAGTRDAGKAKRGEKGARPGEGKAPANEGAGETPGPGMAPPALDVAGWVNSEPLTLAALKGKVVVLDFWGTFCAPCKKLMPHLNELYAKHRGEGLAVIGVSEDEKADIEKFAKAIEVTYPLAADRLVEGNGVTLGAYKIVAIPTVYLIGRNGKIVWTGEGAKLSDRMVLDELAKR